ncbi:glycoside hydrolase family 88 protein [Vallitaleaceae bacterium 9-2]
MEQHVLDQIQKYLDQLIEKSSPISPAWNMEKILSGEQNKWNYIDGCMMKAILDMYFITEDKKYLEFVDQFIDYFVMDDGQIKTYEKTTYNLDNINEAKVLYPLYELTGKEKYRKAIETIYAQLQEQPRTQEGNFWHKQIYPNQIWLDGLYMAQPFYMSYETKYNGFKNYKDIVGQFKVVEAMMKDSKSGLYYHAYDSSREMFWCDKTTGLSKNFWGRAMGWYVMAILDTVEAMDEQIFEDYKYLIDLFKEVIDALLKVQSDSGMFYQVLDRADVEGNYLETSASAIIAYAIFKGVNMGVLPNRYAAYGYKTYEDICRRYLKEENGQLSLGGTCLVAGLGGKERRDGTIEYYLSEPVVESEAKGVAPFLMCYTEILRFETSTN